MMGASMPSLHDGDESVGSLYGEEKRGIQRRSAPALPQHPLVTRLSGKRSASASTFSFLYQVRADEPTTSPV